MAQQAFDWQSLEDTAVTMMVAAVRDVHQQHPQERLYGATFHAFYDDGTVIYWPCIAVGTEESLARRVAEYQAQGDTASTESLTESLRWSSADLPYNIEPDEHAERLALDCCDFAARDGTFSVWQKTCEHFMRRFPRAAKKARQQLIREGVVDKNFIIIAEDEAGELVPLSLTRAQLLRHFPHYDADEKERRRLTALPLEQQLSELVPLALGVVRGTLYEGYEELLKAIGRPAVAPLAAVVRGDAPGERWLASKLIAEINDATDEAIAALCRLLDEERADNCDRAWAACALARLGNMAAIVARIPGLPLDIAAAGLAAPYRSFRDDGRFLPLDYRPLEAALEQHPQLEAAVAHELQPGRGYCRLTPDEIPAARAGLTSTVALIRAHAQAVLKEAEDKLR
ncbi:DUF4303 domain-containing protein [Cronobacter dublinensis]